MRQDDLEHILAGEDEIQPTSGFTASVMEAVRQEAATPPPIPFPWRRAVPGIMAAVVVLLSTILALVHFSGTAETAIDSATMLTAVKRQVEIAMHFGAGWIVLALLLSLASVAVSMRLSTARG